MCLTKNNPDKLPIISNLSGFTCLLSVSTSDGFCGAKVGNLFISVSFFSVRYFYNVNQKLCIVDVIDNSIIANSYSVTVVGIFWFTNS